MVDDGGVVLHDPGLELFGGLGGEVVEVLTLGGVLCLAVVLAGEAFDFFFDVGDLLLGFLHGIYFGFVAVLDVLTRIQKGFICRVEAF